MTSLERPHRPYTYYDQATSVCASCLQRVEAKILIEGDLVIMEKWCPQHGRERVLLADDAVYWRAAREDWLKPAEMPFRFQTPMKWGCPYDCGLCPDHQQHACVAIVEVSDRCNLNCPACFAMSGTERQNDRSLPTIEKMLDGIVRAERANHTPGVFRDTRCCAAPTHSAPDGQYQRTAHRERAGFRCTVGRIHACFRGLPPV
jgi:uncharacterized radical SAM superfamily Fe-S cluster-containing enzyme